MHPLRLVLASPILLLTAAPTAPGPEIDPLGFFEGRTEGRGTVKVMMRKAYKTRSLGHGRIERDGSLTLVQRVEDEGKPPHDRRWRVRQTGPGRFSATMTEAVGPVTIEKVGNRYRFRFKMKGKLSAEQWMTPLPGGRVARNSLKVRKLGVVVATTSGTIRKLGG
jgi:uncharacterized protein DUF3833